MLLLQEAELVINIKVDTQGLALGGGSAEDQITYNLGEDRNFH